MVMKIGCEVEQVLNVTIVHDDNTTKTVKLGVGDYVTMSFNKNGVKRTVSGTVTTIHANPYNGQLSRNDWYIVVNNDNNCAGMPASVKINIINILDVTLVHSAKGSNPINTPDTAMRVTDIRVKDGFLQISQNWGESWLTVGINDDGSLSDDFVGPDKTIADKITEMIGSDQYASSEEFVQGVIDIINEEVDKRSNCNCRVGHREDKSSSIIEEG